MAPRRDQAQIRLERTAGWVLLAGSAFLIIAALLFGAIEAGNEWLAPWQSAALVIGLLVTLFGLISLEEALAANGERLLPRFGTVAFGIGTTSFVVADALGQATGQFTFELERLYTLLACVAIALFGWSILRSRSLPAAVGWFAIAWAVIDGALYLARILQAPLGPNIVTLLFGLALVRRR